MQKEALRRLMSERRAACDPALGSRIGSFLDAAGIIPSHSVVAGFWPLAGEIDIRPVLLAAVARGHRVALPVAPRKGEPLLFRQWRPGEPLRSGRFGTQEPAGAVVVPDVLLVPLLAFDRFGGRLGYGGGYYDRTFAAFTTPVVAVGCGFALQEVDRVPVEPHDRHMDAIATETGLLLCGVT